MCGGNCVSTKHKTNRYAPTKREASSGKKIRGRGVTSLTDEQIRVEYRKMPFINRIVRMGAGLPRVRRIVRALEAVA